MIATGAFWNDNTKMPEPEARLVFLPKRAALTLTSLCFSLFPALLWVLIWLAMKQQEHRAQVVTLALIGLVLSFILSIPLLICVARIWFMVTIRPEGMQIRSLRRGTEFFSWSDIRWVRLSLHPRGALCAGIGLPGKRKLWLHDEWFPAETVAEEIARRSGVVLDVSDDVNRSTRIHRQRR